MLGGSDKFYVTNSHLNEKRSREFMRLNAFPVLLCETVINSAISQLDIFYLLTAFISRRAIRLSGITRIRRKTDLYYKFGNMRNKTLRAR